MAGFACISRCRTHQLVACPCQNHSQPASSSRRRGGMTLKHTHCLCGFADTAAYQKVSDPKFVQPERERLLQVADALVRRICFRRKLGDGGGSKLESRSDADFLFGRYNRERSVDVVWTLAKVEYPGRTDVRTVAMASQLGVSVGPHLHVQVSGLGMVVDSRP